MSRIGKQPIPIPSGVEVNIKDHQVTVKGPKGSLTITPHQRMKLTIGDRTIHVERKSDERLDRSLHGLTRTLLANMVEGVTKGFSKQLEIQGVGYRVQIQGGKLLLSLGFSHTMEFPAPEGINFEIDKEKKNIIIVSGLNKELVGQTSAEIRSLRPPEPYKGKGIRYVGETIRRKAGKAAAAAAKAGA